MNLYCEPSLLESVSPLLSERGLLVSQLQEEGWVYFSQPRPPHSSGTLVRLRLHLPSYHFLPGSLASTSKEGEGTWAEMEELLFILQSATHAEAELLYFGHLMQRADSLEKTLMLGKIEGRRKKGQQGTRCLDGFMDSVDMSFCKLWEMVKDREAWRAVVHWVTKSRTWVSDLNTPSHLFTYFSFHLTMFLIFMGWSF